MLWKHYWRLQSLLHELNPTAPDKYCQSFVGAGWILPFISYKVINGIKNKWLGIFVQVCIGVLILQVSDSAFLVCRNMHTVSIYMYISQVAIIPIFKGKVFGSHYYEIPTKSTFKYKRAENSDLDCNILHSHMWASCTFLNRHAFSKKVCNMALCLGLPCLCIHLHTFSSP